MGMQYVRRIKISYQLIPWRAYEFVFRGMFKNIMQILSIFCFQLEITRALSTTIRSREV